MIWSIAKVIIAGTVISFSSWLASKKPGLAGFIMALPISSMIALVLFYGEFKDAEKAVSFAKSIVIAVPLSLVFFVPFLFAAQLKLSFPALYIIGVTLLTVAYFVHRWIIGS